MHTTMNPVDFNSCGCTRRQSFSVGTAVECFAAYPNLLGKDAKKEKNVEAN